MAPVQRKQAISAVQDAATPKNTILKRQAKPKTHTKPQAQTQTQKKPQTQAKPQATQHPKVQIQTPSQKPHDKHVAINVDKYKKLRVNIPTIDVAALTFSPDQLEALDVLFRTYRNRQFKLTKDDGVVQKIDSIRALQNLQKSDWDKPNGRRLLHQYKDFIQNTRGFRQQLIRKLKQDRSAAASQ